MRAKTRDPTSTSARAHSLQMLPSTSSPCSRTLMCARWGVARDSGETSAPPIPSGSRFTNGDGPLGKETSAHRPRSFPSKQFSFLSRKQRVNVKGFKAFYINKHKKMASAVSAIIKFVEDCSQSGSLEVGYYLKAISDLGLLELGFRDVQLFLFRRDQNVLLNLIGLHYCIFLLNLPPVDVMEVIESCQVSKRQVCVSWFMLGRWFYGFRLPDEHRSRTVSLIELAVGKDEEVLGVLNRGAIHEVLRVQITRLATTAA